MMPLFNISTSISSHQVNTKLHVHLNPGTHSCYDCHNILDWRIGCIGNKEPLRVESGPLQKYAFCNIQHINYCLSICRLRMCPKPYRYRGCALTLSGPWTKLPRTVSGLDATYCSALWDSWRLYDSSTLTLAYCFSCFNKTKCFNEIHVS